MDQDKELPNEGMMFVGDKGKILTGFNIQNPQLLAGGKIQAAPPMTTAATTNKQNQVEQGAKALPLFVDAVKSGKQYPGNFRDAEFITEAINLYAVAQRTGKMLKYDSTNRTITNVPEAIKYLSREYRTGWDPATI
jgi:hypothetical protein